MVYYSFRDIRSQKVVLTFVTPDTHPYPRLPKGGGWVVTTFPEGLYSVAQESCILPLMKAANCGIILPGHFSANIT